MQLLLFLFVCVRAHYIIVILIYRNSICREIDGTTSSASQRRQSAPPKPLKSFDPNKSRDEAYVKAMTKFIEWRNNERKRRASEAATTNFTPVVTEIITPRTADDYDDHSHTGNLLDNSNNQQHPAYISHRASHAGFMDVDQYQNENSATVDEHQAEAVRRIGVPRQMSLPSSNMPKNYVAKAYKRKKKGPAPQPNVHPNVILENEVKEFEGYHCNDGFGDNNGNQSNPISPPMKFYKQNSNPYPLFANDHEPRTNEALGSNAITIDNNGNSEAETKRLPINLQNCPAKPKRLLLKPQNMQKNTKELAEAHFQGTYKNYEVHSPYYESRTRDYGMATIVTDDDNGNNIHIINNRPGNRESITSGTGRYSPQYQAIINKHGEIVEYAIPFCDQRKRDSQLEQFRPHDEVDFAEDDMKHSDTIINQNFRFLNGEKFGGSERSSMYIKRPRRTNEHVLITDLDKSMDSSKTLDDKRQSRDFFDELNSISKWSGNASKYAENNKSNRDLADFYNNVKASVLCCRLNELKPKVTVLKNTYPSPIDIMSGMFRKSKVTLRNYPMIDGSDKKEQVALAAEAIKRDLDILR